MVSLLSLLNSHADVLKPQDFARSIDLASIVPAPARSPTRS
jgi:hypothetical protein